jgi:hypothetical protein
MTFVVCRIMTSYGPVGYVEVIVLDACNCLYPLTRQMTTVKKLENQ